MKAAAALALVALALAGCETTAEKSAKLERAAKVHQVRAAKGNPLQALVGGPAGRHARVVSSALVHTAEGTAVVVGVRNLTATALADLPLLLTVEDAAGSTVYTNNAPGLSPALTGIALLPAHATLEWVDDQVQAAGSPATVTAKLGEGHTGGASSPALTVSGRLSEQNANGGTVEGTVANPGGATQHEVIVYISARHGGTVASAGRAVLAEVPAHGSSPFQAFLIGDPSGASLQLSAPPTS